MPRKMPRTRTATVNFTLRLREDLRRQLDQIAEKENRSLNEEMVHRLEGSLRAAVADEVLGQAKDLLKQSQELAWARKSAQAMWTALHKIDAADQSYSADDLKKMARAAIAQQFSEADKRT